KKKRLSAWLASQGFCILHALAFGTCAIPKPLRHPLFAPHADLPQSPAFSGPAVALPAFWYTPYHHDPAPTHPRPYSNKHSVHKHANMAP
ncbi:uncharacterized protein SETTUDRAFT_165310, partial [Exserohilum turcica Et28A]